MKRRRPQNEDEDRAGGSGSRFEFDFEAAAFGWKDEPVEVEITDVLDLHSFRPDEVPDLVRDYLDEVYLHRLRQVRIIHGRGTGVQRQTVRTILSRDPRVEAFGDAPPEAGGWGATWVRFR